MNKYLFFLMLAFVVASFVACSDDKGTSAKGVFCEVKTSANSAKKTMVKPDAYSIVETVSYSDEQFVFTSGGDFNENATTCDKLALAYSEGDSCKLNCDNGSYSATCEMTLPGAVGIKMFYDEYVKSFQEDCEYLYKD